MICRTFEPITMIATFPFAVVVGANSPAKDLKEFAAYAKANKVNYGMGEVSVAPGIWWRRWWSWRSASR